MSATAAYPSPETQRRDGRRWVHLVASVFILMAVAGAQYAWPLLATAPGADVRDSFAAAQNALAAYVIAEAVFVPLERFLCERLGGGLAVAGVALVVAGLVGGGSAGSIRALAGWAATGGVGAALLYGATVGRALRRFPDRHLACLGATAAACVAAAVLSPWTLAAAARVQGAFTLLVLLGLAQAAVILVAALFIVEPPPGDEAPLC